MSETVGIRYEVDGTAEAAAGVTTLADATRALGVETDAAGESVSAFEQDISTAGMSHEQFARLAQESTQQTIQFGQRLQAAMSAIQGVAAAFGADGDGAGLISRTVQSSTAMAQLGGTLGPQGALVGGIIGAAIPAITALMNAEDAAAESARQHEAAIRGVASAALARRTDERQTADLHTGTFGADTTDAELVALRDQQSARLAEREENASSGGLGQAALAGFRAHYRERIAAIDAEITRREAVTVAAAETEEAIRRTTAATEEETRIVGELEAAATRASEAADGAARLEQQHQAAIEAAAAAGDAREAARAQRVADAASIAQERYEQQQVLIAAGNARQQAAHAQEQAQHRAELAHYAVVEATKRRIERQDAQAAQARSRMMDEAKAKNQQLHQAYLESIQDEMSAIDGAGASIGNVFSSAFQQAIQGQAAFGAAVEDGIKQVLLQYGTQMVAEGAGALLTAVGLAFMNPPAAGAKAAEGAGKIALGVGLGAAGAAMTGSGGSSSGKEGPAKEGPRGGAGGSGDGGAVMQTIIIQQNAPTVMGGTHAEVGRAFIKSANAATRRYGRAA